MNQAIRLVLVSLRSKSKAGSGLYTAVIGDMLASRTLSRMDRRRVQSRFTRFIDLLNQDARYSKALVSKFAITLGDEFQCVLSDASVLPDLIWDIANAEELPEFRVGIGYGRIDTEIPAYAINLDGPALHHAREAIDAAKSKKILGGVFAGFGGEQDAALNGVARLLWFHLHKRTAAQRKVIGYLRQGMTQVEIAQKTNRTPQAVSEHAIGAGWEAYDAGERGFRAILAIATSASKSGQRSGKAGL